jgi:hypothetical protein
LAGAFLALAAGLAGIPETGVVGVELRVGAAGAAGARRRASEAEEAVAAATLSRTLRLIFGGVTASLPALVIFQLTTSGSLARSGSTSFRLCKVRSAEYVVGSESAAAFGSQILPLCAWIAASRSCRCRSDNSERFDAMALGPKLE